MPIKINPFEIEWDQPAEANVVWNDKSLDRQDSPSSDGQRVAAPVDPPQDKLLPRVAATLSKHSVPALSVARALQPAAAQGVFRPALEAGGAMLGGGAGLVGGPLGSLAGAGLGYAGGRQLATTLEKAARGESPQGLVQGIVNAARDIPAGAAMQAGGAVIGAPIQKGLQAVGGLAKRMAPKMYESALQGIPKTIPKYRRDKAITTALEEKIPPTMKGMLKLQDKLELSGKKIGAIIDKAAKQGDKIKTADILKNLDEVEKNIKKSDISKFDLMKLNRYKEGVLRDKGEFLTPRQAQDMKSVVAQDIAKAAYKTDPKLGVPAQMRKSLVDGIKDALIKKYPQIGSEYLTYSNLKGLEDVIEKTAQAKTGALMKLGDIGAAGTGAVLGGGKGAAAATIINKIVRMPGVVSNFSFLLNKASKGAGGGAGLAKPGATAALIAKFRKEPLTEKEAQEIANKTMNAITPSAEAAEFSYDNDSQLTLEQQARQAYVQDEPEKALKLYERALKAEPEKAGEYKRAMDKIKSLIDASGQIEKVGVKEFQKVSQPSKEATPVIRKATQAYRQGDYSEALKGFQKALVVDPQRAKQYQQSINTILREKKAIKNLEKKELAKRNNLLAKR